MDDSTPLLVWRRGLPHGFFEPIKYGDDGAVSAYAVSSFDATVYEIREVRTNAGRLTMIHLSSVAGLPAPGGEASHWAGPELQKLMDCKRLRAGERYRFAIPALGGEYLNPRITIWGKKE